MYTYIYCIYCICTCIFYTCVCIHTKCKRRIYSIHPITQVPEDFQLKKKKKVEIIKFKINKMKQIYDNFDFKLT